MTILNAVDIGTATTGTALESALATASASLATAGITYTGDATNGFVFTAADGRNIELTETTAQGATDANDVVGGFANTTLDVAGGTVTSKSYGKLTLTSGSDIVLATTGTIAKTGFSAGTTTATVSAIGSGSIATLSGAQSMIDTVDAAMTTVNGGRADLGALQARFESVANTLSVAAETAAAARSRVQDADFAAESANLARNQVLQQAGISMLAQANAMPQQVLALLQ